MKKAIQNTLISWVIITFLVILQFIWVYTRNGFSGFEAYMQESAFTYIPITLISVGMMWLLAGLLLWLIYKDKITKTNLLSWSGFFIMATSYLNILRERVRYGDIGYYIDAAVKLYNHQPLPGHYLYPPIWATLLSFFTPLGEDNLLIICWTANIVALFLFYFLLQRMLEHYQFSTNSAAIITTTFMMLNVPLLRTLLYVQVNLHVINFIFLSLLLYKKYPFFSAFFLALAVHFKASPALLVLAFLLEWNWKWLAYFAIHIILIAFVTYVNYGITPFLDFIYNSRQLMGPRLYSMHDNSFDSIISVTLSYFRVDKEIIRILIYIVKGFFTLSAIIVGLRSKSLFPQNEHGAKLHNAVIPFMYAMTIASPILWEHHGIFLTLPLLILLKTIQSPAEWILFSIAYFSIFLVPTFDFFPWSYTEFFGILIILGLLWFSNKRESNSFILKFNHWATSVTG